MRSSQEEGCWWCGSSIWGAFILVLGLWWLLGEVGAIPFQWSWAGPLALVAVGLSMVLGGLQRRKHGHS